MCVGVGVRAGLVVTASGGHSAWERAVSHRDQCPPREESAWDQPDGAGKLGVHALPGVPD